MQMYWVSFIKALDPNKFREPGSPEWDQWTAKSEGGGEMTRLVVQSGVNATTTELVSSQQKKRCETLQPWFIHLKL